MKLSDKLIEAINDQINKEYYSAYLYRSMALSASAHALHGTTKWMRLQAHEEVEHAEAMISYLESRGVRPELRKLGPVPSDFKTLRDMLTDILRHEQSVTKSIEEIVRLATEEGDYGARIFFEKFIVEQEEEEETAQTVIDRFELMGDYGVASFDAEMGSRE